MQHQGQRRLDEQGLEVSKQQIERGEEDVGEVGGRSARVGPAPPLANRTLPPHTLPDRPRVAREAEDGRDEERDDAIGSTRRGGGGGRWTTRERRSEPDRARTVEPSRRRTVDALLTRTSLGPGLGMSRSTMSRRVLPTRTAFMVLRGRKSEPSPERGLRKLNEDAQCCGGGGRRERGRLGLRGGGRGARRGETRGARRAGSARRPSHSSSHSHSATLLSVPLDPQHSPPKLTRPRGAAQLVPLRPLVAVLVHPPVSSRLRLLDPLDCN